MEDEHHLDRDGRRVAWREAGTGRALLLLQGYAAGAADWDPTFLAELTSSFRVLRPDPRGVGGSELGEGEDHPYTVSSSADDAVAVLDAADVTSAVVVGWSMGGFVAQTLCSQAPSRVEALALLGTDPGGSGVVHAAPDVWARLLDHEGSPREQAERLLALLFPEAVVESLAPDLVELVAAGRAALDPAALLAQEAAMDAWHRVPPPSVPADAPPVLAVAGAEDVVVPPANLALLAERWPACRTVRIEGAGHAVVAQEPLRVAALVRAVAGEDGGARSADG